MQTLFAQKCYKTCGLHPFTHTSIQSHTAPTISILFKNCILHIKSILQNVCFKLKKLH